MKFFNFGLIEKQIYQNRIKELEEEVSRLKTVIDGLNDTIYNSPVAFDWSKVEAFSIERGCTENRPQTIIGYFLPGTTEVAEWFLNVNDEEHNKLVQEFRNQMSTIPTNQYVEGKNKLYTAGKV